MTEEMYELVCKDRFDKVDKKQDEVLALLRGKNGDAGLVERVRVQESRWKIVLAGMGVIFIALIGQLIEWVVGVFK